MVHPSMHERVLYHPLVEHELKIRGYVTYHEPRLGRHYPDFICECDSHTLIVECKLGVSDKSVIAAVSQLINYRELYEKYGKKKGELRIALASHFFKPGAADLCKSLGIEMILVLREHGNRRSKAEDTHSD